MCTAVLAQRKDPKWHSEVNPGFCVVPLEIGDTITYDAPFTQGGTEYTRTALVQGLAVENRRTRLVCELDLS